jgi:hypothetical protein
VAGKLIYAVSEFMIVLERRSSTPATTPSP